MRVCVRVYIFGCERKREERGYVRERERECVCVCERERKK